MLCSICKKEIKNDGWSVEDIKDMCVDCYLPLPNEEKKRYRELALNNNGYIGTKAIDKTLTHETDANYESLEENETDYYHHTKHYKFILFSKIFSFVLLIVFITMGIILGNEFPLTIEREYDTKEIFNYCILLGLWCTGIISFIQLYGISCFVENTDS